MNILQILRTLVTARGLEVLLLDKEVTTSSGATLGVVVGIKRELSQDKIWVVVNNLGQENILPIEQIASVADKVILFDDLLPTT